MPHPRRQLLAVGAGGALGAPARYEVSRLVHVAPDTFPWPTFWTNVSGAFLLGVVLTVIVRRYPLTRYARAFFATGFVGAYTTFSTFAMEGDLLVKHGHPAVAAAYTLASIVVGFGALTMGVLAARRVAEADPVP